MKRFVSGAFQCGIDDDYQITLPGHVRREICHSGLTLVRGLIFYRC